ncbi:MAG: CAP domain-containing protein [Flavobacteriales bacterium]|nr:CAP domain-containing protein [Flavobacteriales bacterium]
MKTLALGLLLCLPFSFLSAQAYTYQNVDELLKKAETDSIAYIERKAALEFHKLINQYRKRSGLDPIEWNDLLWVATINHNTWMDEADELSHHERQKTTGYTGTSPGSRLDFAAGGRANMSWSGENALYNYSCSGKTRDEIAANIAQRSFEQWKASPGHNENMLGSRHASHGVAFKITGSRVWGTDLFASAPYNIKNISEDTYLAQKPTPKKKRLNLSQSKRTLQEGILADLKDDLHLKNRQLKNKNSQAKSRTYALLRKKHTAVSEHGLVMTEVEEQEIESFLGLFNKKQQYFSAILLKKEAEFDSDELSGELSELIKKSQTVNSKSKLDLAIAMKKQKGMVKVCLVSIVTQPTGKIPVF